MKKRNNADKLKEKLKWKWRERQWQHREETLAEWDDSGRGQEEYNKDRSRWWFHQQQFRAREFASMDEADRL
ncbi:unnamed protein product [Rhizophagus irregularis]|nr:unnamed protein product [Rhizophagus irregularis]